MKKKESDKVAEKVKIESENITNNVIVEPIKEESKVEVPPVQDTNYHKCRSCNGISETGPECNACIEDNYRICPDCCEHRITIRQTICMYCSDERDKEKEKREQDKKYNWLNEFKSMNIDVHNHLKDCKDCEKCVDCENCIGSKDLVGKKFVINNVQFTEKEYQILKIRLGYIK